MRQQDSLPKRSERSKSHHPPKAKANNDMPPTRAKPELKTLHPRAMQLQLSSRNGSPPPQCPVTRRPLDTTSAQTTARHQSHARESAVPSSSHVQTETTPPLHSKQHVLHGRCSPVTLQLIYNIYIYNIHITLYSHT